MVHGKEEGTTCACILILIHFPSCFNVCLSLRSTAAPVLAASHARRKHPSTLRNPPNWRCIQSFIWSRHVYRLPSNGADLRALWVWALKQGAANMKLHTYLIFRRSSLFTSYPVLKVDVWHNVAEGRSQWPGIRGGGTVPQTVWSPSDLTTPRFIQKWKGS